jgi:iron complex transport system substrate-binding protein
MQPLAKLSALLIPLFLSNAVAAAPSRIADLWFAHNAATVMLGAGDKIVVTVDSPGAQPWLYQIAPKLHQAVVVTPQVANIETLLAAKVDMAFVARPEEAARLNKIGIPARALAFKDVKSLRASLKATADALGTPLAQARARDYEIYLDQTVGELGDRLKGVEYAKRPRVLHIASTVPLRADGDGTIVDEWIKLAGGRNAATGLHGSLQPVSVEQIAQWNPDVIIVGGQDAIPDKNPFSTIPALRGRKLIRNPSGVYQWDRYSPEFALQVQWAAKLLHPEVFASTDMTKVTADFYRRFFNYPMSAVEAESMLTAQPPPSK